jgi:hypothetical protein
VEFREFRDQLVAIDGLLHEGGIEAAFVQAAALEHAATLAEADAKAWSGFARTSALARRCNVARVLTGLSYREFAVRAAESGLLQWFSRKNEQALARGGIRSGLCPRDPAELQKRLQEDAAFRTGLRRRGGTEARIAIFQHHFVGSPCRAKGFAARECTVGWAVLAHNLWVLARLKLRQERQAAEAVQAKAA